MQVALIIHHKQFRFGSRAWLAAEDQAREREAASHLSRCGAVMTFVEEELSVLENDRDRLIARMVQIPLNDPLVHQVLESADLVALHAQQANGDRGDMLFFS